MPSSYVGRRRAIVDRPLLPRDNSLNLVRLVLASLVIVSHSFTIGGFGPEPSVAGRHLGTLGLSTLRHALLPPHRWRVADGPPQLAAPPRGHWLGGAALYMYRDGCSGSVVSAPRSPPLPR